MFDYDPETGVLTWRERARREFPNLTQQCSWNAKYAGKPAGTLHHRGYVALRYNGRFYLAHRVIWLYVYGHWPNVTDHINRIRDDNRICNLRDGTHTDNMQNLSRPKHFKSPRGVSFSRQKQKWRAYCYQGSRQVHIGLFKTEAEAIAAVRNAAR